MSRTVINHFAVTTLACVLALLLTLLVSSLCRGLLRRRERHLAAGRAAIVEVAVRAGTTPPDADPAVPPALTRLLPRERARIMLEVAPMVSGASLATVRALADAAGVTARAHAGLHSRRWIRRLAAARLLTAVDAPMGAGETRLLRDRRGVVRAQATTWAAATLSQDMIDRIVPLVADPDGLVRFAAKDTLVRAGNAAVPAVRTLLESAVPATVTAALEVAATLGHPGFVAPASRIAGAGSTEQRALAATVLGACGDPSSTAMLHRLLTDPGPPVRRAAVRAVADLGDWSAVAAVARLLHDEVWPVRREAGLALLRLGAPGLVMLREAAEPATGTAAGQGTTADNRTQTDPGAARSTEVAVQALQVADLAAMSPAGAGG